MKTKHYSSLNIRHSALVAFGTGLVAVGALLLATSASYGSTLDFNGSTAYVTAGSAGALKVTGANLTLEAWIKPTGPGSGATEGGVIMGREGEYLLTRFPDGTIQFALANTSPGWTYDSTGIVVPTNQWTHVALTYDGVSITLYLNGAMRALRGGSGAIGDADAGRNDFIIGARQASGIFFKGQIDEVHVWNIARPQADIQATMNRPLVGNEPGLLACYCFDEGVGLTTADATGHGLTGTLAGGPLWDNSSDVLTVPVPHTRPAAMVTSTSARLQASINSSGIPTTNCFWLATNSSTALAFNGTTDSVSFGLGQNNQYNAYPLTVTAWVKTAGPGGSGGIVNKYVSAAANGWQIYLLNGQVRAWYYRDASNRVQSSDGNGLNGGNVDDGQWHHVAFTLGAAGGKLYVDGRLMVTNAWAGTAGPATAAQPVSLGVYPPSIYFAGQIDDITVWNVEKDAAAIAQLMTTPPTQSSNLLGYWPLDEGSGNAVHDAWGRTTAGRLAGSPLWVSQARPLQYFTTPLAAQSGTNLVLELDGASEYVRVPNGVWFSNEFTIESWVFERSYNNYSRLIDFGNGAPLHNVLLALSSGTSGKPYFGTYPTGTTMTAPEALPLNEWVHLAATLKNGVGTIYVNGVALATNAIGAASVVTRTNNFIGRSNWPTDSYANALFDELRIWNVARTPTQLRQYMFDPVSPDDPTLLLNYRFDELSGPTAVDSRSTSPQNGTLTNGASRLFFERASVDLAGLIPGTRYHFRTVAANTNSTEFGWVESFATPTPGAGAALEFNGTNDFVRIAGFGNIMPTTNVTVEFWQRVHGAKSQSTFALEPDNTANRFNAHVPWGDGIVYWDFGNISGAGRLSYTPPESLVGTWQHFALVSSVPGNYMRIYRNGVLEASATHAAAFVRGGYDLILGHSSVGAPLDGELDEFRVWSMARTGADILRDYNRRLQGNEPGLVACYHLDEGAGNLTVDATANGKDGLLPPANSPAWVPSTAPVGWPVVVDSEVSEIHVGDVTINATIKGDSATDTRVWIEYGQYLAVPGSAENQFYGYVTNSGVTSLAQIKFDGPPDYVGTFTNINFSVAPSAPPPEWPGGPANYFGARYVGSLFLSAAGFYTFYANSDDGSQILVDGQLIVTNDGVHGALERGATTYLTAGHHWFDARMFDWYNYAVFSVSFAGPGTPKQVIPAVAFQRHEVSSWTRTAPQTFPGASGIQDVSTMVTGLNPASTYVLRVVVANVAGTNYGPELPVQMGSAGAFTALFLNGIDAYVQVTNNANFFSFPGTDQFTLEAWINPSWIGATQAIVSKFNHPLMREYFLALDPEGHVVFDRQGSDYVSSGAVAAGQYTHVAATYDGTVRRIYINGVMDPAADPGSGSITNWGAPFLIGARYWSNALADFFPGAIDDVRVWQVARSLTQIAGDMDRRLTGFELGLVGYYRFDETRGTVALDMTPYQNDGYLMNGASHVASGVQFACSTPIPSLNIEWLDFAPGVLLWWPITCDEYILEVANSSSAPPEGWYPVWETVTPIGGSYVVILLADQYDRGFFRLRRL